MTKEDLKAGRCYRAKKPRNVRGFYNDRQVKRLTETQVQYDGPAVAWGRKYPLVSIEKFLAWASHDVTDDLPPGEWQDFHD